MQVIIAEPKANTTPTSAPGDRVKAASVRSSDITQRDESRAQPQCNKHRGEAAAKALTRLSTQTESNSRAEKTRLAKIVIAECASLRGASAGGSGEGRVVRVATHVVADQTAFGSVRQNIAFKAWRHQ